MAKKKKAAPAKDGTNLKRQRTYRKKKEEDGFVCRTYWIPEDKQQEVKAYVDRLAEQAL